MSKRELTLCIFLSAILFFAALASAADVAYVYRKTFKIDDNVLNVFKELGLTVDLIDEKTQPSNYNSYKFIFVGDENFRKTIPINNYPSVVASYYHADTWGLTDNEGVSQLGATHPLSVLQNSHSIPVYTQAQYSIGSTAIPYYYLDDGNKAPSMEQIAATETTSSGYKVGDVISYAGAGSQMLNGKTQQGKLCFFGIIESDYWTPQARNLFKDCVGFVAAQCSKDTDCPANSSSLPFCQDSNLYRYEFSYTCEDGTMLARCVQHNKTVLIEDCAYDCQNSACVGQCSTNSDCGTDTQIDGLFCSGKNISQLFEVFTCNNPGTSNSYCSSANVTQTIQTCSDACVDGACVNYTCSSNADCDDNNVSTQDICHNPATPQSYCTNEQIICSSNADCGVNGFIGSKYCNANKVVQDYKTFTCENPATIFSSCSSSITQQIIQTCADACVNGTCATITCTQDSDCDDSIPLTLDKCINPGTIISECRNTPINCNNNLDCGFTGFFGSRYCSLNNIFQNYQTSSCNNPTTLNSTCDLSVSQNLIQQCQFACFDGICVRCDENADCDDNNVSTQDICHNPATISSSCENIFPPPQQIICFNNIDCGTDSPISSLFCSNNNINQLFRIWTCNNPATPQSYCSSNFEQRLIQTCADICQNGQCFTITCYNDADCDDSIPLTLDKCINPGTISSSCENTPFTCSSNADCGTNGFTGDKFCQGNGVYQNYRTYTCQNPNTVSSNCAVSVTAQLLNTCDYACIANGICVRCDENADCDDSDVLTQDICINPATISSSCQNNFIADCHPGETRQCGVSNVGVCKFGTQTCQASGNWGACVGAINPSTEICDGSLDEDCDGQINEGCQCVNGQTQSCGTSNIGICKLGIQTCANGVFGTCVGAINPSTEICDGKDNDCDGSTDENNPCPSGQICTAGQCVLTCANECSSSGARQCNGNGYQVCGNYDSDSCLEWSGVTTCTYGCSNGYCNSPPSCTDECSSSGARQCAGAGYQVCGNYDSDSCLEWSGTTNCGYGKICSAGFCVFP